MVQLLNGVHPFMRFVSWSTWYLFLTTPFLTAATPLPMEICQFPDQNWVCIGDIKGWIDGEVTEWKDYSAGLWDMPGLWNVSTYTKTLIRSLLAMALCLGSFSWWEWCSLAFNRITFRIALHFNFSLLPMNSYQLTCRCWEKGSTMFY